MVSKIKYSTKPINIGKNPPVLIDGVRTPFLKSFGHYQHTSPIKLFCNVIDGLIRKTEISKNDLTAVICGTVISHLENHNIARDSVLELGLPSHIHGMTLNRACTSSLQAVVSASEQLIVGDEGVILCGGVENLTDCPISYSKEARQFLVQFSRARSSSEKMSAIKNFSAKSFLPVQPDVVESFTGLTMGQHAEIMAKINGISRKEQDEFCVWSHKKAALAAENGLLKEEIIPVWIPEKFKTCVDEDDLIRKDTSVESIAGLKPSFDKRFGTLTAANSSALTDGAAACLISTLEGAKKYSLTPKAKILDYCTVGVDPEQQLLIGPSLAIPLLLKRNNLTYENIDIFEIHEAFAAQVLSCLKSVSSKKFVSDHLGDDFPVGEIPMEKLNPNGGALAIGHPFGATGIRLLTSLSNELQRKNKSLGIVAICAAGGMAQAMLIERQG